MKAYLTKSWLILLCLLLMSTTSAAMSWRIDDTYIGGDDHGRGDVIHPENQEDLFAVDWMNLDLTDNWLTVDIHTDFGLGETYGTDYGDLFLSIDGWQPYGDAPYLDDNAATGEDWEYVFDVSQGTLYNIQSLLGQEGILNAEDVMPEGGTFRDGQEVLIDASAFTDEMIASQGGSVYRSGTNDEYYSMRFDVSDLQLDPEAFELALHWSMTCANDVIEGMIDPASASVPEPSTLLLLGLGLLGVFRVNRKKMNVK